MSSMWTAVSDRDYYGYFDYPGVDYEPDYCVGCGAQTPAVCEEDCFTNQPAEEPAETNEAAELQEEAA